MKSRFELGSWSGIWLLPTVKSIPVNDSPGLISMTDEVALYAKRLLYNMIFNVWVGLLQEGTIDAQEHQGIFLDRREENVC